MSDSVTKRSDLPQRTVDPISNFDFISSNLAVYRN